jgi:hypothetical protein
VRLTGKALKPPTLGAETEKKTGVLSFLRFHCLVIFRQKGTETMADDARISTALPRHPKTVKLQRRLGPAGCWSLVCLLLWVADNRSDGDLEGLSTEDIEIAAGWSGTAGELAQTLSALRFLDGEENTYSVHDWAEHNPYVAARQQRVDAARAAVKARWERSTPEQRKRLRAPSCER